MSRTLLVLGWHNVEPSWHFPGPPGSGADDLAEQLRFLARFAHVVQLDEALGGLARGDPLPARAVAVTFDDGYRDNLGLAVPILERLGLPATFFLVPGLLSKDVVPWWEVLAWAFARATWPTLEWQGRMLALGDAASRAVASATVGEDLKRRDRVAREAAVDEVVARLAPTGAPGHERLFMDWDDARAVVRRGFAVGSHSMTHPVLSREEPDVQESELAASREVLQRELAVPVRGLAYPNGKPGDYDGTSIAAATRAGYDHAVTTDDGWHTAGAPRFEVRRVVVSPAGGVAGLRFAARSHRHGLPLAAAARMQASWRRRSTRRRPARDPG